MINITARPWQSAYLEGIYGNTYLLTTQDGAMKTATLPDTTASLIPFKVENALVALELGSTDETILQYLDFLTDQVPIGSAYFLHVIPPQPFLPMMNEWESQPLLSYYEINDEVIDELEAEIARHGTKENVGSVYFEMKEGDPLTELLLEANVVAADLVIIGQKERAFRHGILAAQFARKTRANALIVPEKAKTQLKRILVPVDFSINSIQAVQMALSIALSMEKQPVISLLNVYELPNLTAYRLPHGESEFRRMAFENRSRALNLFCEKYIPAGFERIERVAERIERSIGHEIVSYAERTETDMIIMGAKGYSRLDLMLMGSVTEKVLALNNRIPTLVVKE